MAQPKRRYYTITFTDTDTGKTYEYTGSAASAIMQQLEGYETSGLPKMLEIVDPETGDRTYINMKCICNYVATRNSEDVDPRECMDFCCIPDRVPEPPLVPVQS